MTKSKKLCTITFVLVLAAIVLGSCSKKKEEPQPTTLAEGSIVTAGATAPDKAYIGWTAALENQLPNNFLTYQVFWQAEGTTLIHNSAPLTDGSLQYTITGLAEKTAYTVWVKVWNNTGDTKDYIKQKFTTPAATTPTATPSLFDKTTYIILTTQQEERLAINLTVQANTADQNGVWLDLNGNGIYDEKTDLVPNFDNENAFYVIAAQTVRVYGKVKSFSSVNSKLTTIDISHNPELTELNVSNNSIKTIDIQKNTQLTKLNVSNNLLTSIDVKHLIHLTNLNVSHNSIETLDVSKNTQLTDLDVSSNLIETLDLSKNTQLTKLNLMLRLLEGEALKKTIEPLSTTGGTIYLTPNQKKDTTVLALLKAKNWQVG